MARNAQSLHRSYACKRRLNSVESTVIPNRQVHHIAIQTRKSICLSELSRVFQLDGPPPFVIKIHATEPLKLEGSQRVIPENFPSPAPMLWAHGSDNHQVKIFIPSTHFKRGVIFSYKSRQQTWEKSVMVPSRWHWNISIKHFVFHVAETCVKITDCRWLRSSLHLTLQQHVDGKNPRTSRRDNVK